MLWLGGGPSTIDMWDLKPEAPADIAGEFKPIDTAVPGVQFTDQLPLLARKARRLAVIRGMSTGEGSHDRATYLLHTGYRMGQPFAYPGLGSVVSKEIGDPEAELPGFVSVGNARFGNGPGYLGPQHGPLVLQNPDRGLENLTPPGGSERFTDQMRLLDFLETRFRRSHRIPDPVVSHETIYQKAARLIRSRAAKAFDISEEDARTLETYGSSGFGKSCLLARRLVEAGVSFVEVFFGGWDTHQQNFPRMRNLLGAVDRGMSALLGDLSDRGLLDSTLVVWMGEFGRTPNINARGANPGRDHFPRAWSLAMWGGGIKGGAVIGKTDKEGASVVERPTTAQDFLATVCELMAIDYTKKNETPNGRPIQIVEKAKPFTDMLV
jgi:hypothetical protein